MRGGGVDEAKGEDYEEYESGKVSFDQVWDRMPDEIRFVARIETSFCNKVRWCALCTPNEVAACITAAAAAAAAAIAPVVSLSIFKREELWNHLVNNTGCEC